MSALNVGEENKVSYLVYPPPPKEWEQGNHYLVYGIPTTQDNLVTLFLNPNTSRNVNCVQAAQVLKLLRDIAGRGAEHIRAIPCLVDASMQCPKPVPRSYPEGDSVLVIALDWSHEPGMLRRGLREEEMECLQGYFGGEARWFKSCSTKDRWPIPTF